MAAGCLHSLLVMLRDDGDGEVVPLLATLAGGSVAARRYLDKANVLPGVVASLVCRGTGKWLDDDDAVELLSQMSCEPKVREPRAGCAQACLFAWNPSKYVQWMDKWVNDGDSQELLSREHQGIGEVPMRFSLSKCIPLCAGPLRCVR